MTELQKMAYEILRTIERENFEYDYHKNGQYKCSTVAKFVQKIQRGVK